MNIKEWLAQQRERFLRQPKPQQQQGYPQRPQQPLQYQQPRQSVIQQTNHLPIELRREINRRQNILNASKTTNIRLIPPIDPYTRKPQRRETLTLVTGNTIPVHRLKIW